MFMLTSKKDIEKKYFDDFQLVKKGDLLAKITYKSSILTMNGYAIRIILYYALCDGRVVYNYYNGNLCCVYVNNDNIEIENNKEAKKCDIYELEKQTCDKKILTRDEYTEKLHFYD